MADLEGIKLNTENISSNSVGNANLKELKNNGQGIVGCFGSNSGAGSTSAIQNPVNGIASGLLGAASDAASALAKAALGESAGEKLSNFSNEITENLNSNLDTFQSNVANINNSVQNCVKVGEEGSSLLSNSVNTVNDNGNSVGLNLNLTQSGEASSSSAHKIPSLPVGNTAGIAGQLAIADTAQNIEIAQINNNESQSSDNTSEEADEEKQVYSCDWGNKAKSSDEIDNKNKKIKSAGKISYLGGLLKRKPANADLNNSNSKIKDELNSIGEQRNEEIKKYENNGDEKEKQELQQRVEKDSQGVQSTDSSNTTSIAKEQGYKNQISSNNSKGNDYFETAKEVTGQAKELALAGQSEFLEAAQINREAAEIFKDPTKIEKALELAKSAVQLNNQGNSNSENATSTENQSRQKQQSAFDLAQENMNTIIPQYEQSTQQRVVDNQKSLDVQKETKEVIENKMNGADVNSTDKIEKYNDKEQSLITKYFDNQNKLGNTTSGNGFLSNLLNVDETNEEGKKNKLADLIA